MAKASKEPHTRQAAHCLMRQRRGKQLPLCFTCVRNSGGCRFKAGRLYDNKGNVEFDFKGPSRPPTYPQRMNQKDTLKSIRAKMSALVTILEPVLQDELLHIASSTAVMYHPLKAGERAICDVCSSDLFSQARFCRTCRFEVCGECLRERREVSSFRIALWTNTLLTSRNSSSQSLDFMLRTFKPSLSR
ncbi:hypothetical protein EDB84DRAFT_1205198 [Lactarius hengduanensis]|nr:hypothetical protein EDB84DRAFT_1205198 [Lactarius hengduanensis]